MTSVPPGRSARRALRRSRVARARQSSRARSPSGPGRMVHASPHSTHPRRPAVTRALDAGGFRVLPRSPQHRCAIPRDQRGVAPTPQQLDPEWRCARADIEDAAAAEARAGRAPSRPPSPRGDAAPASTSRKPARRGLTPGPAFVPAPWSDRSAKAVDTGGALKKPGIAASDSGDRASRKRAASAAAR